MPRIVAAFRIAAILEACSWMGLLIGMAFKYSGNGEAGVHLFGPIHGGLFMVYVLLAGPATRAAGWSARGTLLALLAAIPPLTTLWVERRLRAEPIAADGAAAA
ncbi:MAG: export protein [Thermoleophilia bacterium]|nr:export protein [Thermoleophilia bacterium]